MRFNSHEELHRYHRELDDAETQGMTLEERLDRAISHRTHTYWWYGQRWDRLRELLKGTDLEEQACCIMANGTATIFESPTASQQFHALEYDLTKSRHALRNCLALATRVKRRLQKDLPEDVIADMEAIERFCAEAGVKPSMLRDKDDSAP